MRSPLSPSQAATTVSAQVPALNSLTKKGVPYRRHDDVEAEIARFLNRPRSEWATILEGRGRLSDETLVFLIRQTMKSDRDLCGRLLHRLSKRAVRIAKSWAQGFDRITTDEIVWQVEIEIIELVLTTEPSRQSDFLEIAFGKAVERRTINAVDKRKHSPMPLRATPSDISGDETSENPAELVLDQRPSPEEIVAQLEDAARRPELIRKAHGAVKDRRHLKAVILRHVRGWPITDKNPNKPSLERLFGMSGRQIQNWISDALEVMRSAIGDKK
jgi:hypothetical protein